MFSFRTHVKSNYSELWVVSSVVFGGKEEQHGGYTSDIHVSMDKLNKGLLLLFFTLLVNLINLFKWDKSLWSCALPSEVINTLLLGRLWIMMHPNAKMQAIFLWCKVSKNI